jgi:hypothetical protein
MAYPKTFFFFFCVAVPPYTAVNARPPYRLRHANDFPGPWKDGRVSYSRDRIQYSCQPYSNQNSLSPNTQRHIAAANGTRICRNCPLRVAVIWCLMKKDKLICQHSMQREQTCHTPRMETLGLEEFQGYVMRMNDAAI